MILVASLPVDRQLHAVGGKVSKRHGFGRGRPQWRPALGHGQVFSDLPHRSERWRSIQFKV
jgi:hypothetical protein